MAQAALRFILAQPQMTVVIPTITSQAELREYAGAADVPELTEDELARVAELYERNFDVAAGSLCLDGEPQPACRAGAEVELLELRSALVDLGRAFVLDAFQVGLAGTAAAPAPAPSDPSRRAREPESRAGRDRLGISTAQ